MVELAVFFVLYTILLLFGIIISFRFAKINISKASRRDMFLLFIISGLMQLVVYYFFGEDTVWKIYPLITHLPIFITLCYRYKVSFVSAFSSIASAYLCCQPAKWMGLLITRLSDNPVLGECTRCLVLIGTGYLLYVYIGIYIAEIYSKEDRSVAVFGIIPIIYYLFDYSMSIYTNYWTINERAVAEFLPFLLCIVYMFFCVIYYREQELKAEAKRNENILRMTTEQQRKEFEAIKRSEKEIRLLRHDMRLLLNNLAYCIENNDIETAQKMISGYSSQIDATSIKRYCSNDTINYVLSNYIQKFEDLNVNLDLNITIGEIAIDEPLLSSVLSNALDNALNAQRDLPEYKRKTMLMMKINNHKLLVSIKNTFAKSPIFVDGMPVSHEKGHGYGTQSIRFVTERLGGTCEFSVQNEYFTLRIIV